MSDAESMSARPTAPASPRPAIEMVGLSKSYARRSGLFAPPRLHGAVTDATLRVWPNEILAVVGESGSGKSTLAKLIVGLEKPDRGSIRIADELVADAATGAHTPIARRGVGMVFQDPASSLNPRMRIRDVVGEGLAVRGASKFERRARATECLDLVGLGAAALDAFPHQFSGGQRQRIAIARAIATKPRFLIADEAVSALDVSVQLQILNLLLDLRAALALTIVFITHNISVVEYLCDRVAVMRAGQIVEEGPVETVTRTPSHRYTRTLIAAAPKL
jgi:ABC-type glutathione transport system ATPase component